MTHLNNHANSDEDQGASNSISPLDTGDDAAEAVIAHALSSYSAGETAQMIGRHTTQIQLAMGETYDGTVAHADNIVVLP